MSELTVAIVASYTYNIGEVATVGPPYRGGIVVGPDGAAHQINSLSASFRWLGPGLP
jgi:hypothetical protein